MTDQELVTSYHASLETIAKVVAHVNGILTAQDIDRRDSYECELKRRHLGHMIETN